MKDTNPNTRTFLRVVLSIILGAFAAIVSFFILIVLFMALGLWGWSDGGEAEYLRRLEINTNITTIIAMVVSLAVLIIIVVRINQNRMKDDNGEISIK